VKHSGSVPAGLKNVPPFPPVAAKLLALLSDPSVELKQVADLIGTDATFTARTLQRVNSIEFGRTNPVSDIKLAVAFLGIDLTRHVVVTHATGLYAKEALKTEDLRRCWQHMVATAVLAEAIAEACGVFRDAAFTAGIIHDIGRLGLLMTYPAEYEQVISNSAERCLDVLDFEAEEFGVDHAEAGRILAERWGLPEEFAVITGRHHDPCEGNEVDLLRIVHVACRLADVLGYDFVRPLNQVDSRTVLADLPARARERLTVTPTELCSHIDKQILEFDSTRGTELPPVPSLEPIAADVETSPVGSETALADPLPAQPAAPESPQEQGSSLQRSLALAVAASLLVMAVAAGFLIWKLMLAGT
jgi:putative nucleotidyltransferase with HDIG domain